MDCVEDICKMDLGQVKQELIDYYDRCLAFGVKCVYDNWEYKVVDNVIIGTKYLGDSTEHIDIVDWIECLCEDSLCDTANTLKSVNLNKVLYLDINTFAETRLESIIANELLFVGQCAFFNCRELKEFRADKLVSIGVDAFRKCVSLNEIHCDNVSNILSCAFMDCDSLKNAHIPNVLHIGNYAFAGCSSLSDIKLQDGVILSDGAFRWCDKLKKY